MLQTVAYRLDDGSAARAAIGLIALATDQTIEHEWRRLLDVEGVGFFVNRLHNATVTTPDTLRDMEARLSGAAALILPEVPLDVIAYACTSASVLIGEEAVTRQIQAGRPQPVAVTTPITAAKAAFRALGLERIALLTPYVEAVHAPMQRHLEQAGFAVPLAASFNTDDDTAVPRITPAAIYEAARQLGRDPAVQGVFISCTNLRATGLVESLEAELGKPVTTSNHALGWHALRLAGVEEALPGRGRLFFN